MSATINWEPVTKNRRYLKNVWAPSLFIDSLEKSGFSLPHEFVAGDIPFLRGMAAMANTVWANTDPYSELIRLIEEFGVVRVWATY